MDSEKDIKKEAKRLAKENGWDKVQALSHLRTKYESENRSEEAAIVTKVISEVEADEIREYDGFCINKKSFAIRPFISTIFVRALNWNALDVVCSFFNSCSYYSYCSDHVY